jgi:hypothetical protein
MAHTAKLIIGNNLNTKTALGKEFDRNSHKILRCNYKFVKPIQENGQPCGHPVGGQISMILESSGNGDSFFSDWMLNTIHHKDGVIVFEVANNAKKNLFFKRAYCISLEEDFDAHGDGQMLTQIVISAEEITFDTGKSYCNNFIEKDEE